MSRIEAALLRSSGIIAPMNANIATAKGIDPCPMCGSDDIRWRKRRPTDFVLTWMRWFVELIASAFGSDERRIERVWLPERGRAEMRTEIREANTGLKTPRRFWRCKACRREGHLF